MQRRYVSIWFRYLSTDWFALREGALARQRGNEAVSLKHLPFVLRAPSRGRMVITAVNAVAESKGIFQDMVLADARAILPDLTVRDDQPELKSRLLTRIAEWCIRFSPVVAADPPDGIMLEATGCPHLWGGDGAYLHTLANKLQGKGFDVRVAIADTPGVAWAIPRYGNGPMVVPSGQQLQALVTLPPEALRLDPEITARLHKLGLHQLRQFIHMPRPSLRRRFGKELIMRIDMALGREEEVITPFQPVEPYQVRLPCMEPITTAKGIELALQHLLENLCGRLRQDQLGLRTAVFKGFRVDGKVEQVQIGTQQPSHHVDHLFKLFSIKLPSIEPALGIEVFLLEAPKVEIHYPKQEKMWEDAGGLDDIRLSELIDRLAGKTGPESIHRYLPDEHHWPERSFRKAKSLSEESLAEWRTNKLRPLKLLRRPERIEVTAPIPDYPPMLFRRKGRVHNIVRADGPERIEQEWWLQQGQHRDYYRVEDEEGKRYWIFRLGHYEEGNSQWFIHGFFA